MFKFYLTVRVSQNQTKYGKCVKQKKLFLPFFDRHEIPLSNQQTMSGRRVSSGHAGLTVDVICAFLICCTFDAPLAGDSSLSKPIAWTGTCFPMSDTSISAYISVFIFLDSWRKVLQIFCAVVEGGSVAPIQFCLLCSHRNAGWLDA